MKIQIETIAQTPVVYMRRTGAYGEQNYQLMQNMKEWIQLHSLWTDDGIIYAIAQDDAAHTPPEQCRYDICFVTEQMFDDSAVQHGTIPSGTYLVFEVPHTAEDIARFWASIDATVANQGKQIAKNQPILERYRFALVEKGYCEFCVPVHAACASQTETA